MDFLLPSGRPVEIQEFTAVAEKVLDDKQEMRSGKWLNKFMVKAMVSIDGKPIPKNEGEAVTLLLDMKSGDRNYLLVKIRILNYGAEMAFNYTCPKCGKVSGYSMNLEEMLNDGTLKVYPYRDDMPIVFNARNGIAEIDYPTGRTEQWLAGLKNMDRIHLAMAMCSSFNGHAPEYKDFAEMYVKDISEIRKIGNNLKGGLDPSIELDCPECESSYTVMLHQIPDFFTPLTIMDNTGL